MIVILVDSPGAPILSIEASALSFDALVSRHNSRAVLVMIKLSIGRMFFRLSDNFGAGLGYAAPVLRGPW